jgi:hypothetical protein
MLVGPTWQFLATDIQYYREYSNANAGMARHDNFNNYLTFFC